MPVIFPSTKFCPAMSETDRAATPLDRLAQFAATTKYDHLPADVTAKAKIHILDTLGAALAGTCSREFAMVEAIFGTGSDTGPLVWGSGRRVSPREAAFANGVAAHAFELDDTGGLDHSGAVVLPAVIAGLSLTEGPVDGKALVASVVVGYEIGRRVLEAAGGYDRHNGLGWHSTGTCGPMAAAAALANLWRLPSAACADAIALSTSFSSGLWAFIHDGSQAKKLHAGRAAEGGMLAALLARDGFAGPSKVFDDVWGGFFRSFNHEAGDPKKLVEGLGRDFKIRRVSLKPYAACRGVHSAIDCVADILGETGRAARTIARIDVRLSQLLMNMCGGREVESLAAAQMSLPFSLATYCVNGEAGLTAYAAAHRQSPAVAAILDRIALDVGPAMMPLDEPTVTLHFDDGTTIARMVPRPTGAPERPMSEAAIAAKFDTLAAMALDREAVSALSDRLARLEEVADCAALEAMLVGAADRRAVFV